MPKPRSKVVAVAQHGRLAPLSPTVSVPLDAHGTLVSAGTVHYIQLSLSAPHHLPADVLHSTSLLLDCSSSPPVGDSARRGPTCSGECPQRRQRPARCGCACSSSVASLPGSSNSSSSREHAPVARLIAQRLPMCRWMVRRIEGICLTMHCQHALQ